MKLQIWSLALAALIHARPQQTAKTPGCYKDLAPLSLGPRQEHSVTSIGPSVYVVGGLLGLTVTPSVEVYNTESNSWGAIPPLPVGMHHPNVAAVDGKLYVLGGIESLFDWRGSSKSFMYDPAKKTWERLGNMPKARGSAAVAAYGKVIYLVGGLENLGRASTTVSAFDTVTRTWRELPNLPEPRDHAGGVVVGGSFYLLGGRTGLPDWRKANTWAINLTATEKGWVEKVKMPTARGGIAAAAIGDKIYTFGGEGNPESTKGVFEQNQVYDTKLDSWSEGPKMQHPRHGMGAVTVGGRIYVPGGGAVISGGESVATTDSFGTSC